MPDTTLTSAELDELERLAKAATPGAWDMAVCDDMRPMVCTAGDVVCHADQNHSAEALPDAMDMNNFAYIATANPATILRLLSLARAGLEAGKAEERLPIETAPKDGTVLLLAHSDAVFDGWWEGAWIDGETNMYGDTREYEPTHWRPLPAPPAIRALPLTGDDKP